MKSYEQMADNVLKRRDAYRKGRRKTLLLGGALTACLALTLYAAAIANPADEGTQLPTAASSAPRPSEAGGLPVTDVSTGVFVTTEGPATSGTQAVTGQSMIAGVDIPSDWTGEPTDLTLEEAKRLALFGGRVPRLTQTDGLTLESCQSCRLVNRKSGAAVDTLQLTYSDSSGESARIFSAIYYAYPYEPENWEGHTPLSLGTITLDSLRRARTDGGFNLILDGGDFCVDVDAPGCSAETVWAFLREMQETTEQG